MIKVAAAIITRAGALLIVRRAADEEMAGKWEFPGGRLKPRETPQICLVRELKEELGITVTVGRLVRHYRYHYPGRKVELFFYRARIRSGRPQRLLQMNVRWVRPSRLGAYDFLEADRALFPVL